MNIRYAKKAYKNEKLNRKLTPNQKLQARRYCFRALVEVIVKTAKSIYHINNLCKSIKNVTDVLIPKTCNSVITRFDRLLPAHEPFERTFNYDFIGVPYQISTIPNFNRDIIPVFINQMNTIESVKDLTKSINKL